MLNKSIARWGRWVRWSGLLAWPFRRRALWQLARYRNSPAAVPHLVTALESPDRWVAGVAWSALGDLAEQPAVDALCALWAESREERLGTIIAQSRYLAAGPLEVRVLSGLKAGRLEELRQVGPEAVPALVQALADQDKEIARNADTVLRSLSAQAAVDALCALWAESREERLGTIIAQSRYLAAGPLEVRVLSGLKAGRLEELRQADAETVLALVKALADGDKEIARNADTVLRSLSVQAAKDALIDLVLDRAESGGLIPLINAGGYRHSVEGRWFLYLVLAGRFDDYLKEDFEFQVLRTEFRAAPAQLQARIREAIVRAGEVRMNPLFVATRRETLLAELSDHDAEVLVRVNSRNRNWAELFKFLWVLPARHIAAAVRAMRQANWLPEDSDRLALFRRLAELVDTLGEPAPVGRAIISLPPVVQQWLDSGTATEFNEADPPPQQIAALGALRKAGRLDEKTLAQAARSEHWLVRLAAAALGGPLHSSPDTRHSSPDPPPSPPVNDGGKEWLDRLAVVLDADAVWGLKPCQVTRDGLEALQAGLSRLPDRRVAGGLNLLEAVATHYTAHDIEIEVGARVVVSEDAFEIAG